MVRICLLSWLISSSLLVVVFVFIEAPPTEERVVFCWNDEPYLLRSFDDLLPPLASSAPTWRDFLFLRASSAGPLLAIDANLMLLLVFLLMDEIEDEPTWLNVFSVLTVLRGERTFLGSTIKGKLDIWL